MCDKVVPTFKGFWTLTNKNNYTNNTICILNHSKKINIIVITKCGSTSFRKNIRESEKLYTQLNENEKNYTTICFLRDPMERFKSGINEIVKRNNYTTDLLLKSSKNKEKFIKYITDHGNEHLTSYHTMIRPDIRIDYFLDLKLLSNMKLKGNVTKKYIELNKIFSNKLESYFRLKEIKEYYKNDYKLYNKCIKSLEEKDVQNKNLINNNLKEIIDFISS
jgi:hypothetical protein